MIGEDKVIKFSGCHKNEACTIVLRGSGQHILDEAERSLHDAICVLIAASKNHKTILGGGNSEMRMSLAVDELAKSMSGKSAMAVEAFARALRQMPTIICENGGYDAAELVTNLRSEVYNGNTSAGINMFVGKVDDMTALGVTECFRVKDASALPSVG